MKPATPRQRLSVIAEAHSADQDEFCGECEGRFPCDTYRWASDPAVFVTDPFHLDLYAGPGGAPPEEVASPGLLRCYRCLVGRHGECGGGICSCPCRGELAPPEGGADV